MLEVERDIGGERLSDPHRGLRTDGREAAASCCPAVAGTREAKPPGLGEAFCIV